MARFPSHLPVREGLDVQFWPHASARWAKLKLLPDFLDRAFKFALVRNPYDLAVSLYSFVRDQSGYHRHRQVRQMSFRQLLELEEHRNAWRHRD
jgi:hypothetical protein